MATIDTDRLIWIVTGVALTAELGDRPLAYRIEKAMRERLVEKLGTPETGTLPRLTPAVISDVYYLNNEEIQQRPVVSIGGPGVNSLSALLANALPVTVAIENTLIVQMDLEMKDPRCAVWGMNHIDTVRAIDLFVSKGYLNTFIDGVVRDLAEE
jgi:hypothetical protein